MKRFLNIFIPFFICLVIFSSSLLAQGSWRSVNTGTTDQINGVYAPKPGLITIVTNMGNALHSTDGGETWHHNQLTVGQTINSISGYYDAGNSQYPTVAVGDDGSMWKSNDGGQNWESVDIGTSNNIHDVSFEPNPTDQNNVGIWACGENASVYYSSNSGSSWGQQSVTYPNESLFGIDFGTSSNGIIGGSDWILYGTSNGGTNWTYQNSPVSGPTFYDVKMQGANDGWAVGSNGTILHTNNGGTSWSSQMSGTSQTLTGVAFTDASNGKVVGHSGTMMETTDGGTNWSQVQTGFTGDYQSITNDNAGNFYAVGTEGILYTNAPLNPSTLSVDKQQLNFGVSVVNDPPQMTFPQGGQNVYVNPTVQDDVNWQAEGDSDWLNATPGSGNNAGYFEVTVNPDGLQTGTYNGSVSVYNVDDPLDQQTVAVNLSVQDGTTTSPPFGSFDTPLEGSTNRGSIAVTGWVLDDVGVDNVKIYHQTMTADQYIGDATFVEGARPDVATSYPDYPQNHKAGWGYMLLTNFLPNYGNGSYTLKAVATDAEGKSVTLGSKTIECDNASAVKPFGAIDAPVAGSTASGANYVNWGWVLTPQPNHIPTDGSTIDVYVDGAKVGNPVYNNYRSDIANLFPCYENSDGAHAYFQLDTSPYDNGVHTIQWVAEDNAGNSDGIGSRYFSIDNTGGRFISADDLGSGTPFIILNSDGPIIQSDINKLVFGANAGSGNISGSKFNVSSGSMIAGTPHTQILQIENHGGSLLNWEASSDQDWLSFDPSTGTAPSWLAVIVNPSGLAAGTHTGYVTISDVNGDCPNYYVEVAFNVYSNTEFPIGEFNFPDQARVVSGTINISGWALDDIGVETVNVYRQDGESMVLLGEANLVRGARPDIAHAYSMYPFNNYAGWSLSFPTNTLDDGEYYFQAEAIDYEGNTTILEGYNFTIDNTNSIIPFGDIDAPLPGEIISGEDYQISGWALTPLPNTIPTDGSTISIMLDAVSIGNPIYNLANTDIESEFPGLNNSSGPGGTFILNTTEYEDGVHTIAWSVEDDQGNVNEIIGSREFVIQNNSNITVGIDENGEELPKETELLNAYPNPFNPSTTISFKLSQEEAVSIIVFDILGRKIATLLDSEFKSAGSYKLYWNGRNDNNSNTASGIYLVMMKAGSYFKTQKMILLR